MNKINRVANSLVKFNRRYRWLSRALWCLGVFTFFSGVYDLLSWLFGWNLISLKIFLIFLLLTAVFLMVYRVVIILRR